MLRIAPPGGMPPKPSPAPPDQTEAVSKPALPDSNPPDASQDSPTEFDQDELNLPKLDPALVVYMGPEMGPFQCGNCVYFEAPNSCHIVSGDIAADGCCNLFTGKTADTKTAPVEEADENPSIENNAIPEQKETS